MTNSTKYDDNMKKNKKVCLACSVGGHLTQMLQLESLYKKYDYFFITEDTELSKGLADEHRTYFVTLANRRMKNIVPLLIKNSFRVFKIIRRERPDVVISTGALNAVPVCYIAKLFGSKVIFIESYAKIYEPTISGRLISPIANLFIVQWESMLKFYKKAIFGGSIY